MAKKFLYIAAVVAAAFLVSGWVPTKEYKTKKEIHIVTANQTVWEIAEKYQPMQDMKMTTGELVHRIYKANHIDPKAYIQPGDPLVIPLEVEAE